MTQSYSTPQQREGVKSASFVIKPLMMGLLFMCLSIVALASHFRGGTITWTRATGTRTVTFTSTHSWRTGTGSPQFLDFGDGTGASDNAVMVSSSGGYDTWRGTVTHTYATDGPYTAFFFSCCRISNLANAADDDFRVETRVCLQGNNNNSPVTSVPAVIQMAQNGQTVNLVATDADGNPVRFVFSTLAQSGINPGPMPPNGFTLSSGGALTYNGTAGYAPGTLLAIQVTVNELSSCGAYVVADFIVEIVGGSVSNQAPVCTLGGPANSTINVGQAFSLTLTGTDANGGNLTVTNSGLPAGATLSPSSGAAPLTTTFNWTPTFAQGGQSYPVSVTFTDPQGANTFCTFTVTVNNACIAPQVTCPAPIVVNQASGLCGANVNFAATATGTNPVLTYSQLPGTFFPVGTQVVTVNATNACGAAQCQFNVTVVDNTPPFLDCGVTGVIGRVGVNGHLNGQALGPNDVSLVNDPGACGALYEFGEETFDECGPVTVTQTGGLPSGSLFPVGVTTNTYVATDVNGNTSACEFSVTVDDVEAPVVNCPADVTVQCVFDVPAPNTAGVNATDNCAIASVSHVGDINNGGAACNGQPLSITRTYSATDVNGLSSTCTQSITVEPQAMTLATVVTNASCYGFGDGAIDITVSGSCPTFSYAWSNGATTEDISGLSQGTYSVTVTDGNGCTTSASYNVNEPQQVSGTLDCCADTFACIGDTVALPITLGGAGPWTLTYTNNSGSTTVVANTSQFTLVVPVQSTTTISLGSLNSNTTGCAGVVCGTATIGANHCGGTDSVATYKFAICHIPPGNANNQHTLYLPQSAIAAHLGHGDFLGTCDGQGPDTLVTWESVEDDGHCEDLCLNTGVLSANTNGNCTTVTLEVACDTLCFASSKVAICHTPPGNPGNAHTIYVSAGAVAAHLGHGDVLGACTGNNGSGSGNGHGHGNGGGNGSNGSSLANNGSNGSSNKTTDGSGNSGSGNSGSGNNGSGSNGSGNGGSGSGSGGSGSGSGGSGSGCAERFVDISVACGTVSNMSNSLGLPMQVISNDSVTGITGIRVTGLPECNETTPALTITYDVCNATACSPNFCAPLVAYGGCSCVQYEEAVMGAVSGNRQGTITDGGKLEVLVFPNPTSSSFNVMATCIGCTNTGSYELSIVDAMGRVVTTMPLDLSDAFQQVFDLSSYADGMYMVVVQDGSHRLVTRVTKQN